MSDRLEQEPGESPHAGSSRSLLALVFAIEMLSAGQAIAEGLEQQVIAKIAIKDLTPELTKVIAEVSTPTALTIAAGKTVRDIVIRHCGRDDENYAALLKEKAETFGIPQDQFSPDYKFEAERVINIPYCVPTESPVWTYTMTPFDQWDYDGVDVSDLNGGIFGGNNSMTRVDRSGLWRWYSRDTRQPLGNPYDPVSNWLAAAESTRSKYISIPIRDGVVANHALASLNQETQPGAQFRTVQKGIQHVTVLSSADDTCAQLGEQAIPESYPVDAYAILRVLGLNRAVNPDRKPVVIPITIGDSGLYYGSQGSPFARIVDTEDFAKTEPNANYIRSQHGTYVATAAGGGPYFMRFLNLMESPPMIRARNIISSKAGCHPVSETSGPGGSPLQDYCEIEDLLLSKLVDSDRTGGIVNLSVAHLGEIDGLQKELVSGRGKFLVVVAAGNSGKEIAEHTYPQRLPQNDEYKKHVLVVAALESDGKTLSAQSSYHKSWVELAAYGCRVPVYEATRVGESGKTEYKIVQASGTSLAAPLVAFAAALLKRQSDMTPAVIKKRLLISADYEPGLKNKVKNNSKLNIARALALYHDVVVIKGQTIYGKLQRGENFVLTLCGVQPKTRRELRSLSIYPVDDGGTSKNRVFFYHGTTGDEDEASAALEQDDCLLSEPNPNNPGFDLAEYEFVFENAETGVETPFKLKDVTSLTLAYKPYWEHW